MRLDPEVPMEPEARRNFHDRLAEVCQQTIRLGALTTETILNGTQVLLDGDLAGADALIAADDHIDALRHQIEDDCLELLATQAPVATDLRTLVTIFRVVHELERSADLMVNVAKATRRLYPAELDPQIRGILHQMGQQAVIQTRTAVDAFAISDASEAAALADMDDVMDDLTKSLFRLVLTGTARDVDEGTLQWAVQMALVGRHYERIADHAVTIAERVQFMVTGVHPAPNDEIKLS
jgi:phosphate transport system protein